MACYLSSPLVLIETVRVEMGSFIYTELIGNGYKL
jgi:hypothetical protein